MAKAKGPKIHINVTALICQSLGILFLIASIISPNWLSNPTGLSYYPYPRTWGLWTVTGRVSQTHSTAWETQSKIAAGLMIDVMCMSTLCKWYEAKSAAYRLQTLVSYSVGIILCILVPLTCAGMICSFRKTRSAHRWATILSALTLMAIFACLCAYFGIMSTSFDQINSHGYYPVPQPSVGLFMLGLAMFWFTCGLVSNFIRERKITREREYEEDMFWHAARTRHEYGL